MSRINSEKAHCQSGCNHRSLLARKYSVQRQNIMIVLQVKYTEHSVLLVSSTFHKDQSLGQTHWPWMR